MKLNQFLKSNILVILITSFSFISADSSNTGKKTPDLTRVTTLWSDSKECYKEGASLISISTFGTSFYRVMACAKYGCKISIKEFGKKAIPGDVKKDQRFSWVSDNEFETTIYGEKKKFYHCLTK